MSDTVRVTHSPTCDFCRHPVNGGKHVPAEYDFKTQQGPWAYGCEAHWLAHRFYKDLGTGKGQRLIHIQSV